MSTGTEHDIVAKRGTKSSECEVLESSISFPPFKGTGVSRWNSERALLGQLGGGYFVGILCFANEEVG